MGMETRVEITKHNYWVGGIMASVMPFLVSLLVSTSVLANIVSARNPAALVAVSLKAETSELLQRSAFPEGFTFGTSSAAYQYEGAVNEGGRGPCIWDSACHIPGIIHDRSSGDVANDHYHRYEEDVDLLADLGVDNYRFSIAWPRIFPDGGGAVRNAAGIDFYNRLIDRLLARGIEPWATLSHFDLPQALQDEFGGGAAVRLYRVKHWITFNEIHNFAIKYTNLGCMASPAICGTENNGTWAYTAGHHMLLSHASAVEVYRTKFQSIVEFRISPVEGYAFGMNFPPCWIEAKQGGRIGLIADAQWYEPYSDSPEDIEATERLQAFQVLWILDPIYYGRYPEVLRNRLGNRLPNFSESESLSLKGSVDFLGINHYTTHYAVDQTNSSSILPTLDSGAAAIPGGCSNWTCGKLVYAPSLAASPWLNIVPWGIYRMLDYIRIHYDNPIVYITENGVDEDNDPAVPLEFVLKDAYRIKYHLDYLSYVLAAIRDGCDVRGYFIWSLLDNFEWEDGLSKRFGIYYVDYINNVTRHPKSSAKWLKEFLRQPKLAQS